MASTDKIYNQLLLAADTTKTFISFDKELVEIMDRQDRYQRNTFVLQLDKTSTHKSKMATMAGLVRDTCDHLCPKQLLRCSYCVTNDILGKRYLEDNIDNEIDVTNKLHKRSLKIGRAIGRIIGALKKINIMKVFHESNER